MNRPDPSTISTPHDGPPRVVLVAILGQSNAEGRGLPIGPRIDPPDPGVLMWDWDEQRLRCAAVPLSSPQQQVGFSPVTQIARRHRAASGWSTPVIILNAGVGGSGLVADPYQGCWTTTYDGPQPHLFGPAVAGLDATISAVEDRFGTTPETWLYWHQGETDQQTSTADYAAALDEVVQTLRSHLGDPTIPFTAGQPVPEGDTAAAVRQALSELPTRVPYTACAEGVLNGGDDLGRGVVHYTRQAAERLGDQMFEASRRAAISSPTSTPQKPLDVVATRIGESISVRWSAPLCRWSDFVVQYALGRHPSARLWQTVDRDSPAATHETFAAPLGETVSIRVATDGPPVSGFTQPIMI